MKRALLASTILCTSIAGAQDIAGLVDYRKYFFVFDKGTFTQLETLPPIAQATGGNYLVYSSTNGDLKIYRDGRLVTIDRNIATLPWVTDHYLGYVAAETFKIFDGDSLRVLCVSTGGAVVQDSVAGWFDDRLMTMHAYYKGESMQIADALMENPVEKWRAGDNTLAWVNKQTNEFNAFYHGEVHTLATLVTDLWFDAGLDMVIYQDPQDKGLKAWYKGEVIDVEAIMPEKITMGRGLFAYISVDGALKVFQGGKTYTAMEFTPDEFVVRDSLVVIHDKNYMKVFKNGTTETLLQYWPQRWAASWGTLVWIDNAGSVNNWHDGVTSTVMQRQPVKDLSFDRGLLLLRMEPEQVKVVWHGQVYEHK